MIEGLFLLAAMASPAIFAAALAAMPEEEPKLEESKTNVLEAIGTVTNVAKSILDTLEKKRKNKIGNQFRRSESSSKNGWLSYGYAFKHPSRKASTQTLTYPHSSRSGLSRLYSVNITYNQ